MAVVVVMRGGVTGREVGTTPGWGMLQILCHGLLAPSAVAGPCPCLTLGGEDGEGVMVRANDSGGTGLAARALK